jgi:uncharacterized protein YndB with AHSA1/START domain
MPMTDLVQRELELATTPEETWPALTDPAWLSAWLADEVELECVPGGEARFVFGTEVREGWVEEVCPPDEDPDGQGRLTFWWTHGEEPASRVELVLSPLPDGRTLLRVAETRPLEVLDLIGMPLPGSRTPGYGPALVAA